MGLKRWFRSHLPTPLTGTIRDRRELQRFQPRVEALEDRRLLTVYTVDSVADNGTGTLRQAILDANNNAGADQIQFDFAGTSVRTINLLTALPIITDPVQIDGASHPGYSNMPLIELNGAGVAGVPNGLYVQANNCLIRALVINRFGGNGIMIDNGSAAVRVVGCFIGVNATGDTALPNGLAGLRLDSGASNNTIGGTAAIDRNLLSGNNGDGVRIAGVNTINNQIIGNFIGTDIFGSLDRGNLAAGIHVQDAKNNSIGGTATGAGNTISGNESDGIVFTGDNTTATGNLVLGNRIGTNRFGNNLPGMVSWWQAENNADDAADFNNGVLSNGASFTAGQVGLAFNFDGSDDLLQAPTNSLPTGSANRTLDLWTRLDAIPSTEAFLAGYGSFGSNGQTFQLGVQNDRRVFFSQWGDVLFGPTLNFGQWYHIAIANVGSSVTLYVDGVSVATASMTLNTSSSSNFYMGRIAGPLGDTRRLDGRVDEVSLYDRALSATEIQAIFTAGSSGKSLVDLGNTGDGIRIDGAGALTVGGTLAGAGNVISDNAASGISIVNDATGALILGNLIGTNGTGTNALGNTNVGVLITASSANTVGGTANGSRNIIAANGAGGVHILSASAQDNRIQGNYVGLDITGLAALGNSVNGVRIDAGQDNTIGGNAANAGNFISGNPVGVVLENAATGNLLGGNRIGLNKNGDAAIPNNGDGVLVRTGASTNIIGGTTGFLRNVISGNDQHGIEITGSTCIDNLIQGNYIGLDVNGTADIGNAQHGIASTDAPTTSIGGSTAGAGNVISGNGGHGITSSGLFAVGLLVEGNFIGTGAGAIAGVGNSLDGIHVLSPNATIGGTALGSGNVISGNFGDGIHADDPSANGLLIQSNFIGTDLSGTVAIPNANGIYLDDVSNVIIGGTAFGAGNLISGNSDDGVEATGFTDVLLQGNFIGTSASGQDGLGNGAAGINLSAQGNTIGGSVPEARNVISGNTGDGILVTADDTVIRGNHIGCSVSGIIAIPNANGIRIDNAANTIIGGTGFAELNVISANQNNGIHLNGLATSDTIIVGNLIGTTASGAADLGNEENGVYLSNAPNNTVGGAAVGERNVISGNSLAGVALFGGFATGNLVIGNTIGLNVIGDTKVGNGENGLVIDDAPDNTIGGAGANEGNVISGNGQGIFITNIGGSGNRILGNKIGTNLLATAGLGNTGDGIRASNATGSFIGGPAVGDGNLIAFNGGNGIGIVSSNKIAIVNNSIKSNGGLGIDLNLDGPSPNDAGDTDIGGNDTLNYPILNAIVSGGSSTTIDGEYHGLPNTDFTLDFYTSASADPSGFGEGEAFLTTINITTDGNGDATFFILLGFKIDNHTVVSAMATTLIGNSSEFSAAFTENNLPLANGDSYIVNEDESLNPALPSVLDNDTDADNDGLQAVLVSGPAHAASFNLGSDGQFTYTPAANYSGPDSFGYSASDGFGNSTPVIVTIDVVAVADAPNINAGNVSGGENAFINLNITVDLFDTDGSETLSPITISGVINGAILSAGTDMGGGVWELTQAQLPGLQFKAPDNGGFNLTVQATSTESSNSDTETASRGMTVTVTNVNPTASIDSAPANGFEGTQIDVVGSASDVSPNDTLTLSWNVEKDGSPFISGNGATFSFTPTDNGSYVVTLTATDDDGGSGTDSVTIAVANVAPTATLTNDGPVNEGFPVEITFSNQVEPSVADLVVGLRYSFDLNNDGDFEDLGELEDVTDPSPEVIFQFNGVRTVRAVIEDKDGGFTEYTTIVTVNNVDLIVTGYDKGGESRVKVLDAETNTVKFDFAAYPVAFKGGVRVTTGDVTGDGVPDIITAPGIVPLTFTPNLGLHVYDGVTGIALGGAFANLLPLDLVFRKGYYIAAADFNADGHADIVVAPSGAFTPIVKVVSGLDASTLFTINAYPIATAYRKGVRVAVGDVNADGTADIITHSGSKVTSLVKVFDGVTHVEMPTPIGSFNPFANLPTVKSGLFVTAADVNGDENADVIVSAMKGAPYLRVFDGVTGGQIGELATADLPGYKGGIRVAATDINADGLAEIITGTGKAKKLFAHVRVLNGQTLAEIDEFFVDPTNVFKGGVFVGGGR